MTRINVVPVSELVDKHLIAEYRELPRIYKLAIGYHNRKNKSKIPEEYILGTGHVTFFYDKLSFIENRHKELIQEMISRGFNVSYSGDAPLESKSLPNSYWKDYEPTKESIRLNQERISERIKNFKGKSK